MLEIFLYINGVVFMMISSYSWVKLTYVCHWCEIFNVAKLIKNEIQVSSYGFFIYFTILAIIGKWHFRNLLNV